MEEVAFYRRSRGWTVEEIVEPVNGADVIARVICRVRQIMPPYEGELQIRNSRIYKRLPDSNYLDVINNQLGGCVRSGTEV